uniref:NADH-ubiquinone oxidoreductase chain 4L n=3 Tax=Obtectomera TaxID=104431 RepID=A0A6H1YCK8_SPOFR|nr:NADH dehydrogenase subunit 4L [Heliconius hecale]YP_009121616.1 NADH dehydrogenase subunit 4L [Heliconius ismenius]AIJ02075.1 NADH dehydrogenase subunit 4L [Heliconius hecale]AJF94294.1 NADH dehydrogenase subunit 4L [Heliconius ismenius]QJA26189.1 NADH dehydrogenase subunit 4L [Spodoptera frugiperda]
MMNMSLIIIMFFIGNMIFVSKQKHLLIVLMSLEFIVLSIFFFFMLYLMMVDYNMYMLMVFLVFSVCEGALGLSILVSMIRTHGNDYFQSYNLI